MITQSKDILYVRFLHRDENLRLLSSYHTFKFHSLFRQEIVKILSLKLIFLDRIVAKLFPVRKSFMQFGNSRQCTNSL